VLLGGNIRGVSNLQLLAQVADDSLCVMELDSWQLQGWGWSELSPQVAVFTNFMSDHLNYYMQGDKTETEAMDLYFLDKANIFSFQEESGVFVTTPDVFMRAKELRGVTLGQEVVLADASIIPEEALLTMPGEHNRLNAALAVEALKALSLTEEEIFEALAAFLGVEGRLQYVGEIDGIKIYNDNNSTTPAATIAGLQAVGTTDPRKVILIAGGAYKNVDPKPLVDEIPLYCKKVVLLPGTGTDMIAEQIESELAASMEEAVKQAIAAGAAGDVLLFSPGFASFGIFKNEYERNDTFVREITVLSQQ